MLLGRVASPATACPETVAVADDAQAIAGLAMRVPPRVSRRERAWRLRTAPPAVKVAWGVCASEVSGEGVSKPLTIDLDATLIILHSDDKSAV